MQEPNNLRILIIDDNPEIHKDFIKILTADSLDRKHLDDLGQKIFGEESKQKALPAFHIDTASQGQEGVERIAKALNEGKPYALAFVDIRMPPGWDGIETIKHIWELDEDIQIVICTAYSDYSWEETVEHLGQRENLLILKKPFDHVAVRQLSMALTKKWQLLRESRVHTIELEKNVKERTKSLEESLSITRGTLESSVDGILVVNNENAIIDYNNKLLELFNIPPEILESKNGALLLEYLSHRLESPEGFQLLVGELIDHPEKPRLGRFNSIDLRVIELYSQSYKLKGDVAGRIWSFRDITSRTLLEDKIKFQATHDSLTKLPNREFLSDFIRNAIARENRDRSTFAVIFFDLDRFKLINDSFSHSTGDELLISVANRIKQNIRENDLLARLSGDEFIFVATNLKSIESLKKIIKKILMAFKSPFEISNHNIVVSPSIGVSIFPENGKTVDELLRNADMAMYHSKELGGAQFQFYNEDMNQASLQRLEMEIDLHHAIENDEFFLCYQPQYDLSDNRLASVEALIRWMHPTKGLLLPIDFIPLAEETGLVSALSEWVLRTACKQNKAWQEAGLPSVRMAVNITTHEFKQLNFVNLIKHVLEETQLKPEYLELELTENIIINSIDATNKIVKLKELGINIAIDDFGTGYSSLNYLRKIPLDRLKIDQSFIQNIDINRGDEVIIQAIITMAKNLNLEILAEGVETQKQLDFLKSKKCGEVQGFYFSKPLRAEQLEELLMNPKGSIIENI